MLGWALPNFGLSTEAVSALRLAGCAGLAVTFKTFTRCLDLLGQSFHGIGVSQTKLLINIQNLIDLHPKG